MRQPTKIDRQGEQARIESELWQNDFTEEFIRNATRKSRKGEALQRRERNHKKDYSNHTLHRRLEQKKSRRILDPVVGIRTEMTAQTVEWTKQYRPKTECPQQYKQGCCTQLAAGAARACLSEKQPELRDSDRQIT